MFIASFIDKVKLLNIIMLKACNANQEEGDKVTFYAQVPLSDLGIRFLIF